MERLPWRLELCDPTKEIVLNPVTYLRTGPRWTAPLRPLVVSAKRKRGKTLRQFPRLRFELLCARRFPPKWHCPTRLRRFGGQQLKKERGDMLDRVDAKPLARQLEADAADGPLGIRRRIDRVASVAQS